MRYITLLFAALVTSWVVYLLVMNLEGLTPTLTLALGVPFRPMAELSMPLWVALIITAASAFIFAVILELIPWYEYTRMIRLQRKQIRLLQEALKEKDKG
jgi:hypothetical protein